MSDMYMRRVWRNGSVLETQHVCALCMETLISRWREMKEQACDEQEFLAADNTVSCQYDEHVVSPDETSELLAAVCKLLPGQYERAITWCVAAIPLLDEQPQTRRVVEKILGLALDFKELALRDYLNAADADLCICGKKIR